MNMGREFLDLFAEWAGTYDDTVAGNDPEYEAVFAGYHGILDKVVQHARGNVLEFGVGTGNLTEKLRKAGHLVLGIEPSKQMREIATQKLPDTRVLDGDFLKFPEVDMEINTIVSTYAFHHLTDEEKQSAVETYSNLLSTGNRIVFADTMFESEQKKESMIVKAREHGHYRLAEDLQREYYPTLETIQQIFQTNSFDVTCKQMNDFVWLLIAIKI